MTLDVRFRPIGRWPLPSTPSDERRSRSTFRMRWNDTLALLEKELGYLDAHDVVIEVDLQPGQIRLDGWPRADAPDPAHPGVGLSFGSKHGPLRYLTDAHDWWRHNVHALGLSLTALRAVDRYGVTRRGEQYQGWAQLGSGANGSVEGRPMAFTSAASAEEKLANIVGEGAHALSKTELYRRALRAEGIHPDRGGSREALEAVQACGRALGVA